MNILLAVATSLNKRGETEITHFDIHISVEEDVPKLQIAMDNLMCVHIATCPDQLHQQETRLRFGVSFASPKIVETLVVSLAQKV